jgi:hypothetical protein
MQPELLRVRLIEHDTARVQPVLRRGFRIDGLTRPVAGINRVGQRFDPLLPEPARLLRHPLHDAEHDSRLDPRRGPADHARPRFLLLQQMVIGNRRHERRLRALPPELKIERREPAQPRIGRVPPPEERRHPEHLARLESERFCAPFPLDVRQLFDKGTRRHRRVLIPGIQPARICLSRDQIPLVPRARQLDPVTRRDPVCQDIHHIPLADAHIIPRGCLLNLEQTHHRLRLDRRPIMPKCRAPQLFFVR